MRVRFFPPVPSLASLPWRSLPWRPSPAAAPVIEGRRPVTRYTIPPPPSDDRLSLLYPRPPCSMLCSFVRLFVSLFVSRGANATIQRSGYFESVGKGPCRAGFPKRFDIKAGNADARAQSADSGTGWCCVGEDHYIGHTLTIDSQDSLTSLNHLAQRTCTRTQQGAPGPGPNAGDRASGRHIARRHPRLGVWSRHTAPHAQLQRKACRAASSSASHHSAPSWYLDRRVARSLTRAFTCQVAVFLTAHYLRNARAGNTLVCTTISKCLSGRYLDRRYYAQNCYCHSTRRIFPALPDQVSNVQNSAPSCATCILSVRAEPSPCSK